MGRGGVPPWVYLADDVLRDRAIEFLEQQGGKCKLCPALMYAMFGVPSGYARAKAFFLDNPDEFLLLGSFVCLAHTAEVTVNAPQQGGFQGGFDGPFDCKLCRVRCGSHESYQSHVQGSQHRINHAASLLRNDGALHTNKGGISVTEQDPEDCSVEVHKTRTAVIKVTNHNGYPCGLNSFNLMRRTPGIRVEDEYSYVPPGLPQDIQPGQTVTLFIDFAPQAVGFLLDVLILEFDGFSVLRELTVECTPVVVPGMPSIAPTAPYAAKRHRYTRAPDNFEPGVPPPRSRHKWLNDPGDCRPPGWLQDLMVKGRQGEVDALLRKTTPDMVSYVQKLQIALWVEELQHEVDIRQYDLSAATLTATRAGLLVLAVPGLAENRPSVMKGDAVYVRRVDGGKEYQGFVHVVQKEEVHLRFSSGFHNTFVHNTKFNVRFSISRSTFIFMHAALTLAQDNEVHPAAILGLAGKQANVPPRQSRFPGSIFKKVPARVVDEPVWTTRYPINEQQKTAVRSILAGHHAPLPYLIFGPPGTGKTMTLTEAAVQVFKMDSNSCLLMTAPSNSAADQLALRMLEKGVPRSQIFRCCAYTRPQVDMPRQLLDLSNWDDREDAFLLDQSTHQTILFKRVIVATCLMASKLHALGLNPGFFTHVFLDEAGHAEEPLSLAAVAGLLDRAGQARFIMAGDPQQLGPVILSPLAQKHGLATSAMERLINTVPYSRDENYPTQPYDVRYITKLIKNYRSHPDILQLPNALFYNGELEACAHRDITHSLLPAVKDFNKKRQLALAPDFPIIFHGVVGKDEREGNSPSWFNQLEAKLVLQYVMDLQDMKSNRPALDDIGIISPYRKQVQKIRTLLAAKYGHGIKVGSVEEFQGQERRVIVISTVRSSAEHLQFDSKHRLGFLSNPKRFNVAITRAKALLIIIGNAEVLMKDPHWMQLLALIQRRGGCAGQTMPPEVLKAASALDVPGAGSNGNGSTMDGLVSQLEALTLKLNRTTVPPKPPAPPPLPRAGAAAKLYAGQGSDSDVEDYLETAPIQAEGGEMPRHD